MMNTTSFAGSDFSSKDMWPREMKDAPRRQSQPIDMDGISQWTGVIGGSALALYGISRRSVPGLVLAGIGVMVAKSFMNEACQSVAQFCPQFSDRPADPGIEKNRVDEASWESFPASDPPSHSKITS
jgi:hypothetical protein